MWITFVIEVLSYKKKKRWFTLRVKKKKESVYGFAIYNQYFII